jgi:hypothetical protein
VAKRKPTPTWLTSLDLKDRLLVWLSGAQSRFETAALVEFGDRWSAKAIRRTLRELQREQSIELEEFDRVRWRISMQGRNRAQRARERAQKAVAA